MNFPILIVIAGQFPTDPKVYLSHKGEDEIFTAHILGIGEVGNSLFFKAVARKQVKEDADGEESSNDGDTIDGGWYGVDYILRPVGTRDGMSYQLEKPNGRGGKPSKDEL